MALFAIGNHRCEPVVTGTYTQGQVTVTSEQFLNHYIITKNLILSHTLLAAAELL